MLLHSAHVLLQGLLALAGTPLASGMLCSAIAAAMTGPKSVKEAKATAKPSGRLCSVIVTAMSSLQGHQQHQTA
jgi:orotidine-5'-phosphate decarboxylase